jgi:ankyrin repeat protein
LDLVLNAKPQLNVKDNMKKNALFYAINAGKGDNVDIIVKLCNEGISIDDVDIVEGHSPLTLAADRNHMNTVKALLDRGANPNHRDKNGNFILIKEIPPYILQ